jgi:TolB protein
VSVDGEKQWKLTSNKQTEVYHDWSPDGKWLVTDISDANELRYDIALINWRTKEIKILTDTTYQYQQSPNFVLKD